MIKNRFFLAFLTLIFASNIHSMKRERETKLSQAQPKSQPFPFTHLPPEMQYKIVTLLGAGSTAQTVEDAGKAINAFAHTNTELKILINDPKICLIIIKNLSKQFKCSDQEATEALQTQEAKERLILQQEFLHICEQEDFDEEKFNTLYGLYQQYVDLNFIFSVGRTEDDPSGIHETLLILGAIKNDCLLIRTLLNHGADINKGNSEGESALMYATHYRHINATKCLLNNPNIAINQQTKTEGWTALLMAIGHRNTLILKLLFDANADPELANNDGLTPLQFAEQIKNQEIIDLIRDAIDKKHGKK